MQIQTTELPDVLIIEPRVFGDDRGFFFESFNERRFAELTGTSPRFVQDNHSRSGRNVLRGLHYQISQPQGKLVRVTSGVVFDVAVDLRRSSPTFGRWVGVTLSAENKRQLWIPEGFAHGFMALRDGTEMVYKASDFYHRAAEHAIRWNDPELGITWPDLQPILSDKDAIAPSFRNAVTFD